MRDFNISLANLRHIFFALRKAVNPQMERPINQDVSDAGMEEVYCLIMRQMYGKKLKELAPFQRDADYIKQEIAYEEKVGEEKRLQCQAEIQLEDKTYTTCNKPCRMKYCTACWKERLAEIHGQPGHVCNVKFTKPEPLVFEMD